MSLPSKAPDFLIERLWNSFGRAMLIFRQKTLASKWVFLEFFLGKRILCNGLPAKRAHCEFRSHDRLWIRSPYGVLQRALNYNSFSCLWMAAAHQWVASAHTPLVETRKQKNTRISEQPENVSNVTCTSGTKKRQRRPLIFAFRMQFVATERKAGPEGPPAWCLSNFRSFVALSASAVIWATCLAAPYVIGPQSRRCWSENAPKALHAGRRSAARRGANKNPSKRFKTTNQISKLAKWRKRRSCYPGGIVSGLWRKDFKERQFFMVKK